MLVAKRHSLYLVATSRVGKLTKVHVLLLIDAFFIQVVHLNALFEAPRVLLLQGHHRQGRLQQFGPSHLSKEVVI